MSASLANYTPTAQASLATARQEARARRSPRVEPEHLLMALLTPASGSAWNLLVGSVGNPNRLRHRTREALAEAGAVEGDAEPAYSYRTERALSEAGDEAQQTGSSIDTTHLLLGLMNEGGAAANILRQAGLDARGLRHWLRTRQRAARQTGAERLAVPGPSPKLARAAPRPAAEYPPLRKALPRLINGYAVLAQIAIVAVGVFLTTRPGNETAGVVFIVLGGWIISLSAHEFAHALVADLGGDHSVRENGYLSFNPLAYTHLLLSIIMPLIFLLIGGIGLPGGAVYVNRLRLRSPRWDSAVSAAGPIASALVAVLFAAPFLLGLPSAIHASLDLWAALSAVVMLNVWAVLFNLLPIPPLDGFGILAPFLPPGLRYRLYALGLLGLWLVIILFWTIDPINQAFWNSVFSAVQSLNVSPSLAAYGIDRFTFWR